MGLFLSKLTNLFSSLPPARILMVGLDAAGKTTILYKLKLNETISTIPTIGFNVETVSPVKGLSFTVWDVGGQEKIRRLWMHYFNGSEGMIFVVDSSDVARMEEARCELFRILDDESMPNVPVEVIANKQDLIGALRPHEVEVKLNLHKRPNITWHVQGACATTGDGIYEAMDTLASMIKKETTRRSWYY